MNQPAENIVRELRAFKMRLPLYHFICVVLILRKMWSNL